MLRDALILFMTLAFAATGFAADNAGAPDSHCSSCGLAVAVRHAQAAGRATTNLSETEFQYSMASITINVGDTVTWKNSGNVSHTTTSDTLIWDSGSMSPGASFSFQFNNAGTFPYHCSFHGTQFNMKGTVIVNNPAPVINSATSASGLTGVPFSYSVSASNTPTSYSASGLPAGLSIDTTTGIISGAPTAPGVSTITLGATNGGGTGNATLTLTVTNPPPPVITSGSSASAAVGASFLFTVTSTNTPVTFAASGLPAGLTLNASTGVISGVPTASGIFPASLSVTNAGGTGPGTLTITVTVPPAPVITSATSAFGFTNVVFAYGITASNNPQLFSATGLPPGLAVSTNGNISGTPTAAGTFNVGLTAINSGGVGSATLTLTIAAGSAPTITSPLSAIGVLGYSFVYTLTASGTPAVTNFTATGLPPGLSFSGSTIAGVPAAVGTYVVTLGAVNAAGSDTKSLVIKITDPNAGGDSDGDGFPDALEIALGSNPADPNSTPFGILTGVSSPIAIKRFTITLNFLKFNSDFLYMTGSIPIPATETLSNQNITVYVGGVIRTFEIRGNGQDFNASSKFVLYANPSGGTYPAQTAKFQLQINKSQLAATLALIGIDGSATVKNVQKPVTVIIIYNGVKFTTTQTLLYSAHKARNGVAK